MKNDIARVAAPRNIPTKRIVPAVILLSILSLIASDHSPGQSTPPDVDKTPLCGTCNDRRKVTCLPCNGEGTVQVPCSRCDLFYGGEPCSQCKGVYYEKCRNCSSSERPGSGEMCRRCKGRGYVVICPTCKDGFVDCPACQGRAKLRVACQFCSGTREMECPPCTEALELLQLAEFRKKNTDAIQQLERRMPRADNKKENPFRVARFGLPQFSERDGQYVLTFCLGFDKQAGGMPSMNAIIESARLLLKLCATEGWFERVALIRVRATVSVFSEKDKQDIETPIALLTWPTKVLKAHNWGLQKKWKAIDLVAIASDKAFRPDLPQGRSMGYPDRFADKKKLASKGGGGQRAVDASLAGLKWLARHQNPGGYWDCDGFRSQCVGSICDGEGYPYWDVGVTGLALLAFLGAGYTHLSEEVVDGIKFGEVVKKGLLWLQKVQDKDGLFGRKDSHKYMYNHIIATLAMCEAYGMTGDVFFEKSARGGVGYLLRARTPYGAWRYEYQSRENDMSVTGWAVMALKSAELAGIPIGQASYQDALNFLNEVTNAICYRVGYMSYEDVGMQVSEKGRNDHYQNHYAMTAVGMLVRMHIEGERDDPRLEAQAKILMQDLPEFNRQAWTHDYYYWYYATLALFMYDGPDSGSATQKYWREWNKAMLKAIVPNQKTKADKCAEGSWDADDRWGYAGGRVYATALNTLTLQVYYRYENVFRAFKKRR